jgi:hypothetical protein
MTAEELEKLVAQIEQRLLAQIAELAIRVEKLETK